MVSFAKFVICALVFVAVNFFSYWMLFAQILPEHLHGMDTIASLLTALAAACLIWRSMAATVKGVFTTAASWAAIAGAVGFCGGFFGPLILTPDANQGPLLGLFITGPLGVIGGGICGFVYALWRRPGNALS
jgi:hypothetical protein